MQSNFFTKMNFLTRKKNIFTEIVSFLQIPFKFKYMIYKDQHIAWNCKEILANEKMNLNITTKCW